MLFTEQINIYYEDKKFIKNIINDTTINITNNTTNNTTNDTTNDNIIYKRIINIDKFYTNIHIVHECISNFNNLYDMNIFDLVIEPSAGSGNFLLNIKHNNKIGLDIEPEHESIIKKSFFEYYPDINLYSKLNIALIRQWRHDFNNKFMPFYYVQMTPYNWKKTDSLDYNYALFRETQEKILNELGFFPLVASLVHAL